MRIAQEKIAQSAKGVGFVYILCGAVRFDVRNGDAGIGGLKFGSEDAGHAIEDVGDAFFILRRHGQHEVRVSWNGVVCRTGAEIDEADVTHFGHDVGDEARAEFDGAGASLVDFASRMSAKEPADVDGDDAGSRCDGSFLERQGCLGFASARASHGEDALVLAVEVEEDASFELFRTQGRGSGHSGFLVAGDENFEGGMFDVGVLGHGEGEGDAQTVIGSEGGLVGVHPAVFDDDVDGIGVKVVGRTWRFFADHVHVPLQNEGGGVFISRGSWDADEDVIGVVAFDIETVFLGAFDEPCGNFFFVFGLSRDLGQRFENIDDAIADFHGKFLLG